MSGAEGEDTATILVTTSNQLVTEAVVTTRAPIITAPVTVAPITYAPFLLGPGFLGFYTPSGPAQQGMKAFQARMVPTLYPTFLTYQMGPGQLTQWSQIHPDSTAEIYLLIEGLRHESRRSRIPHEEQVELEDDDFEEDDDQWGTCLENLEKGQQTIQRNLEEVMLTIPEIMM
ncbi:UNVERIFIED_CONTAM: hypothetical protein K2H54_045557 [Gekko kuhli]